MREYSTRGLAYRDPAYSNALVYTEVYMNTLKNRSSNEPAQVISIVKILGQVVESEPFINFLLHNHFITEKFKKKKSGDVNDEAKFSLFILLHKRAKPILPPGRANSKPFPSARVEPLAQ